MQDKKKLEIFLKGILFLLIAGGLLVGYLYKTGDTNITDAIKFKEEYESLNNTIRESDGATYSSVDIPLNNPMKYVDINEAIEVITKKSGILYIGANWCPWCRNAVEVLIKSANENNLNTIYYLDLSKYRNVWDVEDNRLLKTEEEKEGYYELLKVLDSILGDETYKITKNGKTYDTKEKRIYMPTVVAIKSGKIIDYHVGTISLDKGQTKYDKLTPEQFEELSKTYTKFMQSIKAESSCSKDDYCD